MARRCGRVVVQLWQILGWVGIYGVFQGTTAWNNETSCCDIEDLVCVDKCGVYGARKGILIPDFYKSPCLV